MSNNIIQFNPQSNLPSAIAQQLAVLGAPTSSPLSEGVGATYAVLSIKGKVFRIRHGGADTVVLDPQTGQPSQLLEVILLAAKGTLSKTYYASGYVEGTTEQPDCSSEDGVHPVAPVGKSVQCNDCRLCPWNVFGSKKSSDGVPTNSKACADSRKVVVVPAQDIANERFGGPMLLRVPAASLTPLADFDRTLRGVGAPFYAVVAQLSFDYTVAFPKLVVKPLRFITDAEAAQVLALRDDPRTLEIISDTPAVAAAAPALALPGAMPAALAVPAQAPPQPVQPAAQPVQAQPQAQPQQTQPQASQGVSFGPPVAVASAPQAVAAPTIPVTAPVATYSPPPVFVAPGVAAPTSVPPAPAVAPGATSTVPLGVLNHVDALLGGAGA
jgi:hypothetical protein